MEWHSLLGVGYPVSCRSVKRYLADVREEHLRARGTPKQDEPILVGDLAVISKYIQNQLNHISYHTSLFTLGFLE